MQRTIIRSLIGKMIWITSFSFATLTCNATNLENLDLVKLKYIQYQTSGQYEKDQQKVIDSVIACIKKHSQHLPNKKLAIVLDIDETSLSNYPDMIKYNFGGTMQEDDDAEGDGHDEAIAPTLKLYHFAKEKHIAIFFITGRREHYRPGTERNLKTVGYYDWSGLILKPENYNEISAAPYKIAARKRIEEYGYEIIANVGDQDSDLVGGHSDRTFKMPNPYYIVQ